MMVCETARLWFELSRHEAKDVEIESSSEETYDSADDIQIEDTVNGILFLSSQQLQYALETSMWMNFSNIK